jgi:hypothetical protein
MTTTQQLSPQLATIIALVDIMIPLEGNADREAEYAILSKAMCQLLGDEADRAKVELLTR